MAGGFCTAISEVHFSVRPNHRLLSARQRVFLSGKNPLITPRGAPAHFSKPCSAARPSQTFAARQRQVVR
jgi:hypothetical protein